MRVGHTPAVPHRVLDKHRAAARRQLQLSPTTVQRDLDTPHLSTVLLPRSPPLLLWPHDGPHPLHRSSHRCVLILIRVHFLLFHDLPARQRPPPTRSLPGSLRQASRHLRVRTRGSRDSYIARLKRETLTWDCLKVPSRRKLSSLIRLLSVPQYPLRTRAFAQHTIIRPLRLHLLPWLLVIHSERETQPYNFEVERHLSPRSIRVEWEACDR